MPKKENKAMFVQALQAAFIASDPERYGHLAERPVGYVRNTESGSEYLVRSGDCPTTLIVTGDSCSAIAKQFIEAYL